MHRGYAPTVLVVDDDAAIRRVVRTVLEADGFTVVEATDGDAGDRLLDAATPRHADVVVLDVMMPGRRRRRGLPPASITMATRVVMLTARDDARPGRRPIEAGADAYLVKPFSAIELLDAVEACGRRGDARNPPERRSAVRCRDPDAESLAHQLDRFASDVGELYRRQKERAEELEDALAVDADRVPRDLRSMAYVVEAKDAYTGQHLERCRVYGNALMQAMGVADDYPDAEFGFMLHDVGKVGVPERILNKPGPLTAAEWRVMRTHPVIGYQILQGIPFMQNAAQIVRCHHEMFDGNGYPAGLRGEEIPLPARVFRRRRVRRHDDRPPVPSIAGRGAGDRGDPAHGRHAVRPRRRRVPRPRRPLPQRL